jgi:excisionase family DNA binding protein
LEETSGLLKAPELAEKLSLSVRQIYYLRARGEIPSIQVGRNRRYPQGDVEKALKEKYSE